MHPVGRAALPPLGLMERERERQRETCIYKEIGRYRENDKDAEREIEQDLGGDLRVATLKSRGA